MARRIAKYLLYNLIAVKGIMYVRSLHPAILSLGIYPRGFLTLIPKGACVRLFMAVFTEETSRQPKNTGIDTGMDN